MQLLNISSDGMMFVQFKNIFDKMGSYFQAYGKYNGMYNTYICFFTIQSLVQIAINVFLILLILEKIGKQNKLLYTRIILILLIFEFGFIFVVAILTSIYSTIYRILFKDLIDYNESLLQKLNSGTKVVYVTSKNFMNFSIAQAVISWILSIPASIIVLISFLDGIINKYEVKQNSQTQINLSAIAHPERTN